MGKVFDPEPHYIGPYSVVVETEETVPGEVLKVIAVIDDVVLEQSHTLSPDDGGMGIPTSEQVQAHLDRSRAQIARNAAYKYSVRDTYANLI